MEADGSPKEEHSSLNAIISFKPTLLQQKIIDVAQDLMKSHYLLDTDKLYYICIRELKDENVDSIKRAIAELLNKNVLVEGKALTRVDLMDNKNRKKILFLIKSKPGIHVHKLRELTGLTTSTIFWHAKMLERFGLIRIETMYNRAVCFDIYIDKKFDEIHVSLHKKQYREILAEILIHQENFFSKIQENLNIPRSTLTRKIKNLIELGVLHSTRLDSREILLEISTDHEELISGLIKN